MTSFVQTDNRYRIGNRHRRKQKLMSIVKPLQFILLIFFLVLVIPNAVFGDDEPTSIPSTLPSTSPTSTPSSVPTSVPSGQPISNPTSIETPSSYPSTLPSSLPTDLPSSFPSGLPSSLPSGFPSGLPSSLPSVVPSSQPSSQPTHSPSQTVIPTREPTHLVPQSAQPTISPSNQFIFSLRPTVLSTGNSPIVKFYLNITFLQVHAITLDDLSQQVILNTTAASMGVSSSYLELLSFHRITISQSFVEMRADIPINLYGYDSVSLCYDSMTNSLTEAIYMGNYTQYLQQLAAETDCVDLEIADAIDVTFLQITDPSPASGNDDFFGSPSSLPIIIGVVIALVIMIVVIGYLFYRKGTFQWGSKKYRRMNTNIEMPSRLSSVSSDENDVFQWNFTDGSRGSSPSTSSQTTRDSQRRSQVRNPTHTSNNTKGKSDLRLGESKSTNPILQRQVEEEWWL